MKIPKPVTRLLKIKDSSPPDTLCLTFYHPTRERFTRDELKRVKGFLLSSLRESIIQDTNDVLHKKILDSSMSVLQEKNDWKEGVVVFGRVVGNDSFILDAVEVLPHTPVREITINSDYDFDQLLWTSYLAEKTLVLSISRTECRVYSFQTNELKKITVKPNDFALKKEHEYLAQYRPSRESSVIHSTGEKTLQKRFIKENQEFMREVATILKEKIFHKDTYPIVVVAHSLNFSDFIDDWAEKYQSEFGNPTFLLMEKVHQSESELKSDVAGFIKNHLKKEHKKIYDRAKEQYDTFVEGWVPVYDAAKLGVVDKLFLKPHIDNKYQDIAQATLRRAIENSSEVIFIDDETLMLPSATLRFKV